MNRSLFAISLVFVAYAGFAGEGHAWAAPPVPAPATGDSDNRNADATRDPVTKSDPKAGVKADGKDGKDKDGTTTAKDADGDRDPSSVFLHVQTTDPVTVVRDDTGETVCTSPCNKNVPVDGRYRIEGARPSPVFELQPSSDGRADVKVAPGSKSEFWVGVGIMGLGAGLLTGGIATLLYWNANRPAVPGGDGEGTDNRYTYAMMAGTGLCILGAIAEIYGGASVINNLRTKVKGNVQKAQPKLDIPSRGSQVGSLPRATSVPVFGGTF